jgi:hypothetical protein
MTLRSGLGSGWARSRARRDVRRCVVIWFVLSITGRVRKVRWPRNSKVARDFVTLRVDLVFRSKEEVDMTEELLLAWSRVFELSDDDVDVPVVLLAGPFGW